MDVSKHEQYKTIAIHTNYTLCNTTTQYIQRRTDGGHTGQHILSRLLHSPNLVVIELSMVYGHGIQLTGITLLWSIDRKCRLGLPSARLHYGLAWPVGISAVLRPQWQSVCTAATASKSLPLGLCTGTVKEYVLAEDQPITAAARYVWD